MISVKDFLLDFKCNYMDELLRNLRRKKTWKEK